MYASLPATDTVAVARDILIVEDDPAQARLFARVVARHGYHSRCVPNGNEALDEVSTSPPLAVVLDLLLPGRSGEDVLAQLKARATTRDIPVIAISAVFRGRETHERLKAAGAAAFLHKPFNAEALLEELRAAIGEDPYEFAPSTQFDLGMIPVYEFIWGAIERSFSGALHFTRGKRHKVLLLNEGQPVAIRSNLVEEALGRRFFRQGRISKSVEDTAVARVRESGRLLGEILVEMREVSREDVEQEISAQAAHKILNLFTWEDGEAWEEPGVRGLAMATSLEGWRGEHILQRGLPLVPGKQVERALDRYRDHYVRVDPGDTLTGIDDHLRVRLRQGVRIEDAGHDAASIYAAWRVGKLHFQPPSETDPATEANRSAVLARQLRARVEEAHREDLFSVLGLKLGASPEQVHSAYEHLAQEYASQRFDGEPERVRSLAATLRARIELAHEILSSPQSAAAYAERLGAWQAEGGEREPITDQLCAQAEVRQAQALLSERREEEARRRLDLALKANPNDAEALALAAWMQFSNAPGDASAERSAVEQMQRARAFAPDSPTPIYYLALLCKTKGRLEQAIRGFKAVLALAPNDARAQSELRLLQRRLGTAGR